MQLKNAGVDADRIKRRVRTGRLHRVHRGVYAVGHPQLSNEGRWMAAVLACGDGAALSHHSAAALWGLLSMPGGRIDVTVPGMAGRRRRRGIHLHRSPSVISVLTRRSGIPVTTVGRTIADLRRVVSPQQLRRAIRQAQLKGFRVDGPDRPRTRSDLEDKFLELCRRHGQPQPEVNVKVGGFEVDFLWRDQRLIIELDSYRYHGTPSGFEADRARDAQLMLLGYDVVRLTDRRLSDDRAEVVATLRALLASSRAPRSAGGR